eukprot:gene14957-14756_t
MCLICGWIYDEQAGLPDEGIAPGTRWADVPMNWSCPECGARKDDFEMAGYQVVLADDGFDALAKIADHQPALVFCDILMPRLDGYQTCALIKKSAKFHATPVLLLSSKDGLFDRARGSMVGAAAYLTKPFTKDSLLAAVREHAGAAPASGQTA